MNSNEQPGSRRVARGRAFRVGVRVFAGAALLSMACAIVWPLGRDVRGVLDEQAQPVPAVAKAQAGDAVTARTRQPRIGQIAIPLHKRRRFEAATATRQDMPYRWQLDSGGIKIYTPKVDGAASAAHGGASGPAAGVSVAPAPDEDPLEAPPSVYGHEGW